MQGWSTDRQMESQDKRLGEYTLSKQQSQENDPIERKFVIKKKENMMRKYTNVILSGLTVHQMN